MKPNSLWTGLLLLAAIGSASAAPIACVGSGGTNCPARIPDAPQAALVSTLDVPAVSCPNSEPVLSVALQVTHGAVGDLAITLQSPGGGNVALLSNIQGVSGECRGSDIDATFTDGGAAPICSARIPSVLGTVAPAAPLAPLLATSPEGTWTLTVTDTSNSGDGALDDWSVDVSCAPVPAVVVPTPLPWQTLAAIAALLALVAYRALRGKRAAR
ncbi:MAG: proprotein convertase P-domain-containing protein [Dokdonella sp.]|uniref:proprotein convertase P-domain-containing protein n=1 Tax=Dokdonella sp. TaxID=2291710 RepID=UPI003F802D47